MEGDILIKTSDFVNVNISASFPCACIEKRFPRGITVSQLKGKLELATGASQNTMKVSVYSKQDKLVFSLDDDSALLGSYHIDDGMRLHVEDSFTLRKEIEEDQSADVKYTLSEEEYNKRSDSLKAFLKQNKFGKYNEEEVAKKKEAAEKEEKKETELASYITVGSRACISVPGCATRLGSVQFVGPVQFKPGHPWIGIRYDEPLGKNDGSCEGVRYFECPPKYGGFVKPSFVEVGDFPEEQLELDEI